MTSVSGPRVGGAAAVARTGSGGNRGQSTQAALGALAADVAGRVAQELGLTTDGNARRSRDPLPNDLYGVEAAATELADALAASPSERGEILRLLHLFAGEVAARMGAVPDSRTVEEIGRLVSTLRDEAPDARRAILLIDRAVRTLAA